MGRPRSCFAIRLLATLPAVSILIGCDRGLGPEPALGSFKRLQMQVFDANCVTCHVSGSSFAVESGLVLEASVAYDNLVGEAPRHQGARDDGFLLVAPGDPDRSLLLHKLRWDLPPELPGYGAPMPLGMDPLPVGQVDFVRRWVLAGAPREGDVVDPKLLDDFTPQDVTVFVPLAPPARGYQIHLGPFPVQPQTEREVFVYKPLGNTAEIWVNRVEMSMRPNTHHFVVAYYREDTPASQLPQPYEFRDVWNADGTVNWSALAGMSYRQRISGAQTAASARLFPEGVALRLPADVWLDLNSHYINRTDQVIYGEVYANLHTVDPASVQHEARALFLNNTQFVIPPHEPGETSTVSRNFVFGERRMVVTLTSHMHEKGERFVIRRVAAGGVPAEVVYETDSWEHPAVVFFDPPLDLAPGEGLRSEVTFHNPTAEPVRFGLASTDEMAIIIGYYYTPD